MKSHSSFRKLRCRAQLLFDEVCHRIRAERIQSLYSYARRTPLLSQLEERLLMSASPMVMVAEVASVFAETGSGSGGTENTGAIDGASVSESSATFPQDNSDSTAASTAADAVELVVIDSRVEDSALLLENLVLTTDHSIHVLLLNGESDGVSQITDAMRELKHISAVHLLTHGRDGEILLGATRLNSTTLDQHAPDLLAWRQSMTSDADILLYGCDVADTVEGQHFVDSVQILTAADIAASTDATGSAIYGGDWKLEYQAGIINSQTIGGNPAIENWNDLLGVITVSTTNDVLDGDTSSVAALLASKGADGLISLREAIIATNNSVGADTIFLSAGTYSFSIAGQGENAAFTGDLDITDSVTIIGAGSGLSTINAGSLDRVIELWGAITTTIEDVTIRGGSTSSSDWGGGILTDIGATLNLSRVLITGNSTGSGAGIYNYGTLVATDTTISSNTASDWGGGLYNHGGSVTLNRVTISGNSAGKDGGGIENTGSGASMSLTNATISGNTATDTGGGIWTSRAITATNSTIAFNTAAAGDGVFLQGGTASVSLRNSILHNPSGVNFNQTVISLGNNIDSDGTAGLTGPADQSSINPLLDATLQNNGGFVATHRLLTGSAAINAGTAVSAPTVDARGTSRNGAVDIGAFEVTPVLTSTTEQRVNQTTGQIQTTSAQTRGSTQAVSMMPNGNYAVVWSSNQTTGSDGNGYGILMRIFRPDGTALTGELQVNQTFTNNQQWATVSTDDLGNGVVVWTSTAQDNGATNGVYARRFNAAGAFVGNEFQINTTTAGAQENAVVDMTGSGSFVIAWSGNGTGDSDGIFYRRYDASGTALDATERLANATNRGTELAPSIAINDAGTFAIAWHVGNDLYVRNFGAGGTPSTGDIQVDNGLANATGASVGIDSTGRTAVLYRTDGLLGIGAGVWGRTFNSNGTERHTWSQISSGSTETAPSIAMDKDGNFIVVYESSGDAAGTGVFMRRYDADFNELGISSQVNVTATGNQNMPSVAMIDLKNFVVVWSGRGTGDTDGVFARQFNLVPPVLDLDTNDSSGATGSGFNANYINGGGPIAVVDSDAVLTDADNANLQSIKVTITNRQNGSNESLAAVTTGTSITANYSGGVLTLSGSDTVARYQQVLRTVTYNNLQNPATGTFRTITVVANDGITNSNLATTSLTISSPANVAPVVTSSGGGATASISVAENTTAVTTLTATDADLPAQTLTYSISGGADAARFSINSSTGVLRFVAAPDFEIPTDNDANNVYEVTVQVSDGTLTDTQAISVTVTAVNDNTPTITSNGGGATASISVAENTTAVTTLTATDADLPAQMLTYSISGGSDAARFSINSTTGVLRFNTAPDYEAPADSGLNNVYDLTVRVTDGTLTDTQNIIVTVTDANDPPSGTSDSYVLTEDSPLTVSTTTDWFNSNWKWRQQVSFNNLSGTTNLTNQIVLVTLNSSNLDYSRTQNQGQDLRFVDPDGTLLEYEIEEWNETGTSTVWVRVPQIDAASSTDFIWLYYGNPAAPAIQNSSAVWSGQKAVLHLNGTVSDSSTNNISITDSGSSSAAGISSGARRFDGVSDSVKFAANTSLNDLFSGGGTISAWINPVSWGEAGYGRIADKASTTFASGALGNGWALEVTPTGGLLFQQGFSTKTGTWQTAGGTVSLNTWQHVAVVYDSSSTSNTPLIFINGVQMAISSSAPTGTLATDAGQQLTIGNHAMATNRTFDGRIDEFRANDSVTTSAEILAQYRSTAGTLVSIGNSEAGPGGVLANDTDPEQNPLSVSIAAGPLHAQFFTLNADGSFVYIPVANYTGLDSFSYLLSDGTNNVGPTIVNLNITPVNDPPNITSDGGGSTANVSVSENSTTVTTVTASDVDLPAQTLTFSVIGGADAAKFTINSSTGVLSFIAAPDYESPTDTGADNVYEVIVQATDGILTDPQAIAVTVSAVNDLTPVIISNDGGASATISVDENSTNVTTVVATDADLPEQSLTYTISGGADAAKFSIDSATGVLTFVTAPNFDIPADSGSNNIYDVIVRVTDGIFADTQAIAVTVNGLNDISPAITSGGGGTAAAISVAENSVSVTTVTATDGDLPTQSLTFSIQGGSDAARFAISSTTGILTFVAAPNHEIPADSDGNNIYDVIVAASDGTLVDTQTLAVTVFNVNEPPVITSDGGGSSAGISISENSTSVTTVTSTDVDGGTATYTIIGGADQSRFTIGGSSGILAFSTAPNFEIPSDSNSNNVYIVTVQVSDGNGAFDTQTLSVTVTNVNEAPVITSNGGGSTATVSVSENSTTAATVTSTDVDGGTAVYSIAGGADQNRFIINSVTGILSFAAAPDFEIPSDINGDNTYCVIVQVSDENGALDLQTINVAVTNVNEAPVSSAIADVLASEDAPLQSLTLSSAYSDPDVGDTLTFSVRQLTGNSAFFQTLSIDAETGILTWQLNPDINGTASVEVKSTDAGNLSTTQTLRFLISAVDDIPVATSASFSGFAGNLLTVTAPGLSSSVREVDGDTLTFIILRQPDHGTVTLTSGGGFEYSPDTGYIGPDSFDYAASDGITLSNTGTASVQISTAPAQSSGGSGSGTPSTAESSGSSSSASQSSGSSSSVQSGAGTPQGNGTSGTSGSTSALAAPAASQQQNGSDNEINDLSVSAVSIAGSGNAEAIYAETGSIGIGQTSTFLARLNPASSLREITNDELTEYSHAEITAPVFNSSLQLGTRQQWFAHHNVMFQQLDTFEEDLSRNVGIDRQLVGSVGAVTTGLSVGYIIWVVRGGMLLSGLLAQMPAWQMLDPLLVIDDPGRDRDDDGETIGSIVDRQQPPPPPTSVNPVECASESGEAHTVTS